MNAFKQTLSTECFLIKLMFKNDTKRGCVYWLLVAMQNLMPLVNVFIWKLILDEMAMMYLAGTSSLKIIYLLAFYLLLQFLISMFPQISQVIYDEITRKTTCQLDALIMKKMSELDSGFFDDPNNQNVLEAAQTSEGYIVGNMSWAVSAVIKVIAFLSGLVIFLSYDVILGVVFIVTYIPGAIVSYRHKRKVDQWSIDNIPETRKKNYYKAILTQGYFAKDLRLYNLSGYFKDKYNQLWSKIRTERRILFKKGSISSFLASLLTYFGFIMVVALSIYSVLFGEMGIGTLVLYIGLAQTTGETFKTLIEDIACQIEIDVPHVQCFLRFFNHDGKIEDEDYKIIPDKLDIEFKNVYFKYPGNDEYTLKNLSFQIESGQKIALIGVNGAGKSTIVKLLLRFYEPDEGQILIGGINIQKYSQKALYKVFGVCFQDITAYSLTLKENIALSDIKRVDCIEDIKKAASASGADKIIKELKCGYESDMTRNFNDNGIELSGGQWQKIELARAFFKNSRFIILDEPSSALDPEAEDYILSSFKLLCEDKGGLIISHRLSSIMMVDKILVVEDGKLIEVGTHNELIMQNGKYAKMYNMQAEKYMRGD